jgi:hypothetical protein
MKVRLARHLAPLSALLISFSIALSSAPAGATEPRVTLGEVSGRTQGGEYTRSLRAALAEEFSPTNVPRASGRDRFVLSVTLVKLSAEHKDGNARATAVVSMTLTRARGNTLYALLSGRATAEESSPNVDSVRDSALRAAVRSALRRLPDAVSSR